MQLVLQYSNLITFGNILTLITGIGSIITAVLLLYWKIRLMWSRQQIAYLNEVSAMLENHTKTIENCIHRIPGHPESGIIPPPGSKSSLSQEAQ